MQVFNQEVEEILRRFLSGQINHLTCVAALDAAVAGVSPGRTPAELRVVRQRIAEANECVAVEMKRRRIDGED